MRVKFESSFARDLRRVKNQELCRRVGLAIERFESATGLHDIRGLKKLKGDTEAYRLRIGNYRLGFLLRDNILIMVRFLDRKNIYRYFP